MKDCLQELCYLRRTIHLVARSFHFRAHFPALNRRGMVECRAARLEHSNLGNDHTLHFGASWKVLSGSVIAHECESV